MEGGPNKKGERASRGLGSIKKILRGKRQKSPRRKGPIIKTQLTSEVYLTVLGKEASRKDLVRGEPTEKVELLRSGIKTAAADAPSNLEGKRERNGAGNAGGERSQFDAEVSEHFQEQEKKETEPERDFRKSHLPEGAKVRK